MRDEIRAVGARFRIEGELASAEPHGGGHIHDTFLAAYARAGETTRYVHQRLNRHVFPDVAGLMENVRRVTDHVAGPLVLVRTRERESFCLDDRGDAWRTYRFVEGTRTYRAATEPAQARGAAGEIARFQRRLIDLPGGPLHETIPGFHDTPARLAAFREAVRRDEAGRAGEARAEIDFVLRRADGCGRVADALATGEIPERVAHHDTKLDNVLFDAETGEAVCVIDLDTVMPGTVLHDFGDLVRTATCPAREDELRLDAIEVRPDLFRAVAEGYLGTADFLEPAERDLLPEAARLITLETALRFLTDHLEGDRYFRIHREGQNLDRARAQLRLVESIEERWEEMRRVIDEVALS